MTFSLLGRCARTGMFGAVVSSSSIAVTSRCAWARGGVGAVATQNFTDPRLGPLGLELLAQGYGAAAVLDALVKAGPHPQFRQLTVIDNYGDTAVHTGNEALPLAASARGKDCVAAANLLANDRIPASMIAAFTKDPESHLAERLVRAIEAGLAAGGETSPVHAAGLYVVAHYNWPIVDLRVDWHEQPIAALRDLWTRYQPQMPQFIARAHDPGSTPF
jgi:uncharacterized Ntn-hydrolase superfamily protein